ncbi:MAG: hypothetical protein M1831_005563 [Alyxoria varia]|nr:MAG: hypothetical protein M1831_005563 [Alyxoria varia]
MSEFGKRRTHRKVRTGCITCKIRRVKCDEGKPECKRCLNTGRKCDGYSTVETFITGNIRGVKEQSKPISHGHAIILPNPSPNEPYTPLEVRCLEYFQGSTLKALSGFTESEFWSRLVLQLSRSEPVVRHAVLAFSSFHETREKEHLSTFPDHSTLTKQEYQDEFALQNYTKSVSLLRKRLSENQQSKTVALVSCILFVCIEFLRGNNDSAIAHLRSGLSILRLQPENVSDADTPTDTPDPSIPPQFARLSLVQSLYDQPKGKKFIEPMEVPIEDHDTLNTLDHAKNSITNLTNAVLSFHLMNDHDLFADESDATMSQHDLIKQHCEWLAAFDTLVDSIKTSATESIRAANMIRLHYMLSSIWANKSISGNEESFDAHLNAFEEIVDVAEKVVSPVNGDEGPGWSPSSFSVDTGLIPALLFTATKCRHRETRRKACKLIRKSPRREGLWDSLEAAKIAELIIRIEEDSFSDDHELSMPSGWARIHGFVIHPRDPIDSQRQLIDLNWKPGGQEQGAFDVRSEYIVWY